MSLKAKNNNNNNNTRKVRRPPVTRDHPLGTMNVRTKFQSKPLNCWDISVLTDRGAMPLYAIKGKSASHKQICNLQRRMGVFLLQHHRDHAGPGPIRGELITSCQRFRWQAFIYQVVVFPWTWQSCSRCEGQQESHILIKDQRAKNKTPPAGTALRLKEMWKGSVVYTY